MGLALVVATVWIGSSGATQWIVLPLGALFTAAYIQGKWPLWKALFSKQNRKLYKSLGITYIIETMIVLALYWLGRGLSELL